MGWRLLPLLVLLAFVLPVLVPQALAHPDLTAAAELSVHGHSHDDDGTPAKSHAVTDHEHHLYVLSSQRAFSTGPGRARPRGVAAPETRDPIRNGVRRPPKHG